MLKFLAIRDFVIVSSLELDFSSGFTALTGETGAGKSILIDALSLALGEQGRACEVLRKIPSGMLVNASAETPKKIQEMLRGCGGSQR